MLRRSMAFAVLFMVAPAAQAHIGDRVIPFFELTDEALQDIDLKDGSIEDWLDVVGEPTLTSRDFFVPSWFKGAMGDNTYNPASLDYRIWLGWNQSSNHLYVAMERTDDIYINEYDRSSPTNNLMKDHDSSIEFLVDGDHSGGYFWFPTPKFCCDTEEEWKLFQNQQAQYYWTIADTPDGRHVDAWFTGLWTDWFLIPPYADGGGTTLGEAPYTSVVEFYVTPFDRLVVHQQSLLLFQRPLRQKKQALRVSVNLVDRPLSLEQSRRKPAIQVVSR